MSYFDNSTVCYPLNSSPATYHSYMCKSKDEYAILDNERLLKTVDYDHLWSVSQEKSTTHSKTTHHISKLRSILSETISHITKNSKLLKGESVELTLEIQLMKTENHTPSNSMVEVTIIQHNKKGERTKDNKFTSTNPKKTATTNSFKSESASQKRRNWFQRVLNRQNDQNQNDPNKTTKQVSDNYSKNMGSSGLYLDQKFVHNNKVKSTNQHPRSNFIKVLPEKIPISGDYRKGYRRVSPEKNTPRVSLEFHSPRVVKTLDNSQKSVVKKISEIFLPTKKAKKNKAVKTALTALKNEVDNIKLKAVNKNEGTTTIKTAPVHNLGKLVGNILDDMMVTPNNVSKNEIKDNSMPFKYQHFFEPVSNSNTKRTELNPHKKRTTIVNKKNVAQSHSDTCCVHYKYDSSDLNIKTSNSVTDCRAQIDSNNQIKSAEKGDSTEMTSTKKYKEGNKSLKRNHKKHAKGDATIQFDDKVAKKRSHKTNKRIGTKKSIIEWNGQTIQVNKEIKTKIEMLIVNELQNLALKEGMECDVIPLHWSEICNDQPVEKMSSFICELDINDKKSKKTIKSKQIPETKPIAIQKPSKVLKKEQNTSKHKHRLKRNTELETLASQPQNKETHIISFGENLKKPQTIGSDLTFSKGINNGDIAPWKKGDCNNDIKITYVNTNIKSWSAESTTVKFKSPDTSVPTIPDSKVECGKSPIFKFGEENNIYQRAISSGFIKRIDSNDCTWKKGWLETTEKSCLDENFSKQLVTVKNTKSKMRFSSNTSNEYQSSIEIELDIKDLELILKEAKQKQRADKVLVNAKCKCERKKQRNIKFTGKNSPSYTNQLLTSAAENLEKYVRGKGKPQNNDKLK